MRLSRFERKILGAMALVALAPLVGALLLGRTVLSDAYAVGVNERIRTQLDASVSHQRDHIAALRDDAERTADAIAHRYTLVAALRDAQPVESLLADALLRYPHVSSVRVVTQRGATEHARPHAAEGRPLRLTRSLRWTAAEQDSAAPPAPPAAGSAKRGDQVEPDEYGDDYGDEVDEYGAERAAPDHSAGASLGPAEARVEVVVRAPQRLFDRLQVTGEEAEIYERLLEESAYVSEAYLYVYIVALSVVIALALGVGVLISRRVTSRVVDLANATQRVGRGDLSVEVPTDGRDEVHELTVAFNSMVRDLRESRSRIDYLQRIGAWQEFARRLAHEIKNPLTPIQLAAQEMHRSYTGEDERFGRKLEDARAIIEEEVLTLRRLVGEFTRFAKLPAARLTPQDLTAFLGDIEPSAEAILEDVFPEGQRPVVELVGPVTPVPVEIDAMMLKRCVDNLVRNALQAMRGGQGSWVGVTVREEHQCGVLIVEDDGPGVPEGMRERIFDPYFTTKSDGTGLGLAIVKKVVLEHGGEITYGVSERGGAEFRMELPLLSPDRAEPKR